MLYMCYRHGLRPYKLLEPINMNVCTRCGRLHQDGRAVSTADIPGGGMLRGGTAFLSHLCIMDQLADVKGDLEGFHIFYL